MIPTTFVLTIMFAKDTMWHETKSCKTRTHDKQGRKLQRGNTNVLYHSWTTQVVCTSCSIVKRRRKKQQGRPRSRDTSQTLEAAQCRCSVTTHCTATTILFIIIIFAKYTVWDQTTKTRQKQRHQSDKRHEKQALMQMLWNHSLLHNNNWESFQFIIY